MNDLKYLHRTFFFNRFMSVVFISSNPLQFLGLLIFLCFSTLLKSQNPSVVIKKYNEGQAFTSITVDNVGNIWAGTNKAGLFKLNKNDIITATNLGLVPTTGTFDVQKFNIQAIAADKLGNVWVGHNGLGGSSAAGGGLERYAINDPSVTKHFVPIRDYCPASGLTYDERDGITSLNVRSIAVDKNNRVWTSHAYHDLTVLDGANSKYYIAPGGMSYSNGVDKFKSIGNLSNPNLGLPFPRYTCNPPITVTPQTRTCPVVAVGKDEVLLSVQQYETDGGLPILLPARLLKYNLDGNFIESYNYDQLNIPSGCIINGIHITPKNDAWITLSAGKGFVVRKKDYKYFINPQTLPCILPNGIIFNPNAVWGNSSGQVFLGTNKGLVVYNGSGSLQSEKSYTLYTTVTNGMLSDNIIGGIPENDSTQWVATDKGIMRLRIGRTFDDELPYQKCNNQWISEIEQQVLDNVINRLDYHYYEITTEICNQNSPNARNCNAEYVFKLMKNDVSLNAPTPSMFPYDNLATRNLIFSTNNDLLEIVKNINAWKGVVTSENPLGQIRFIKDILSSKQRGELIDTPAPFETGSIFSESREGLTKFQESANSPNIISCAPYELYNTPNFIKDRVLYRAVDAAICGSKLKSTIYDPVWIVADDKNLTFTNYTQPGHLLHPGKVFRSVIEECGKVKIVTLGTGLNYCGSNLFGRMNGNGNVIAGSILFKNIDLKLKNVFETR